MNDKSVTNPLDAARILSEALPHMQRYDEETIVIKYGGHAMGDEGMARSFARDIVLLEQTAINPVVVHGGGPQIEAMLKRAGVQSQFAGGLRITEPAADLAAAAALVSSLSGVPLPSDAVYYGELGLSGAIRPVTNCPSCS